MFINVAIFNKTNKIYHPKSKRNKWTTCTITTLIVKKLFINQTFDRYNHWSLSSPVQILRRRLSYILELFVFSGSSFNTWRRLLSWITTHKPIAAIAATHRVDNIDITRVVMMNPRTFVLVETMAKEPAKSTWKYK